MGLLCQIIPNPHLTKSLQIIKHLYPNLLNLLLFLTHYSELLDYAQILFLLPRIKQFEINIRSNSYPINFTKLWIKKYLE